jgi:hypothetical protein
MQIAVTVEVSERGIPTVLRLEYPPGMERTLTRWLSSQAHDVIKEVPFRWALNSRGEPVEDEIRMKIPLR